MPDTVLMNGDMPINKTDSALSSHHHTVMTL